VTELAIPTAELQETASSVDLAQWASRMADAARIASTFAATPFVPASLRVWTRRPDATNRRDPGELDVPGTVAVVTAALLTGAEVGIPPMAALRSIDVIDGAPAIRALALRALVLRAGHQLWVAESTSTRAIVTGIRAGTSRAQTSTWTRERAKDAGLLGKPNWTRHPAAMLVSRATAECARWVAPEVLLGLPYAVEELTDGDTSTTDEVSQPDTPAPARRRVARKPKGITPAPESEGATGVSASHLGDEPPLDAAPAPLDTGQATAVDTEPSDPDGMSPQQRSLMHVLFGQLGMTDREDRLELVRDIIDRDIASSNELASGEASLVLDVLTRSVEGAPRPPDDVG